MTRTRGPGEILKQMNVIECENCKLRVNVPSVEHFRDCIIGDALELFCGQAITNDTIWSTQDIVCEKLAEFRMAWSEVVGPHIDAWVDPVDPTTININIKYGCKACGGEDFARIDNLTEINMSLEADMS